LFEWFQKPDQIEFIKHDELVLALPKNYIVRNLNFYPNFFESNPKGTAIATAKHDKLIPEACLCRQQ